MLNSTKKIFFSYGHDTYVKYVRQIRTYLEEQGYSVFFDVDELSGSSDWEAKLEEGLKKNDKVIFFITPHSARRPDGYCLNELAMALTYKKDIVPIMLEYEVPPLSIVRQQYLDMKSCFTKDGLDEDLFTKHMENLLHVLEGKKELDFEGAQAKLFEELNPLDITANFAKHKQIIGREWIIDRVDNWVKEYPDSKVLWITAQAGYGKSALAVYLANNHPDVAGIHFCSYNRPNTKDAKQVVKTLAYHLQTRQLDGYFDAIKYVDTKDKNAAELFTDLIANPLNRSQYNDERNLFIVIDALDETLDDPEEELIDLIGSDEFKVGLPDFVKIIVISRPDARLRETLAGLDTLELNVEEKKNEEDCVSFLKLRLEQLKKDNIIDSAVDNEKIIKIIVENSGTNMLYLNKFLEEVEKHNIHLGEPDTFPKGLNGIYKGFFKRVTTDEDKYDKVYAPILEVILAYGEPIPKLLLGNILDGVGLKSFNHAITNLGTMIQEDDDKIDIYHKSLKDWLVSDANKTYFVDIKDGKKKIQIFVEKLTENNYKKEYIDFFNLNKIIIDNIYLKKMNKLNIVTLKIFMKQVNNRGLEDFFSLIRTCDDKKTIKLIYNLIVHYYTHGNKDLLIMLSNYAFEMVTVLYKHNSELWMEEYLEHLFVQAVMYSEYNKKTKAIKFLEEASYLTTTLYEQENRWEDLYFRIHVQLGNYYAHVGKYDKSLIISEKNILLISILYEKNTEKWLKTYLDQLQVLSNAHGKTKNAIDPITKAINLLEPLYEIDKIKWSETLSAFYMKLSSIYVNNKVNIDALIMAEKALNTIKPNYLKDKKRWIGKYLDAYAYLALMYAINNRHDEAEKRIKHTLDILQPYMNTNFLFYKDISFKLFKYKMAICNSSKKHRLLCFIESMMSLKNFNK